MLKEYEPYMTKASRQKTLMVFTDFNKPLKLFLLI